MSVQVTSEGMEELKKSIQSMGNKAEDIVSDALMKSAEIIRNEMKRKVRVSKLSKKHIRDNIPINKEATNGSVHSVGIGWTKKDNSEFFYTKYLEWGTSRMRARPFMQPAINKKGKEAQELLINEIKKGIELNE